MHELNTLFEIGRRFVGTLEATRCCSLFSYALMGQLLLTRILIVLSRRAGRLVQARGISAPSRTSGRTTAFWEVLASLEEPLRVEAAARGPLAEYGLMAVVPDPQGAGHARLRRPRGAPVGPGFSDDELAFAGALANQAIVALENAWLIEETIEKRRLEEELAIASNIQSRLFPKQTDRGRWLPACRALDADAPRRRRLLRTIDLGDGRW
jgi:sigma-B regulation protein RsbU (phosphoserine phosphatase)